MGGGAKKLTKEIAFTEIAYEAAVDADVLVMTAEWHEFCRPDSRRIDRVMRRSCLVGLRDNFDPTNARSGLHLRGEARCHMRSRRAVSRGLAVVK